MLWTFHGGLHLDDHKALSANKAQIPMLLPDVLILPLQQHIGLPATPFIQVGDNVLKGQMIAHCGSRFTPHPRSAPIHAPTSGTVLAIEDHPVLHPSGLSAPCVVIQTDGQEQWRERQPIDDFLHAERAVLHRAVMKAGIVGLGGAGFPSHLKLEPNSIDTLIINGAECEPYITCDDHLMQHNSDEVVQGACIFARIIGGVKRCIIAIEDNKPQALAAIQQSVAQLQCKTPIVVIAIPTLYPTGGERQLIKVLTGKEVPLGKIPAHLNIIMHNVATSAAVYRAVAKDEPMIARLVTVTGKAVKNAGNVSVLLGTPIDSLLRHCGCDRQNAPVMIGGPMMGMQATTAMPVIKTTNCILAYDSTEMPAQQQARACIRCGRCADVCPVQLLPQQLYWYTKTKDFNQLEQHNLNACIECGCCAYVCPSHIPLVQYYRHAKSGVRQRAVDKKNAEIAKRRNEFKLFRLEREKAERQARHEAKKARTLNKTEKPEDNSDKQALIQAAIARAKAKKAAQQAQQNQDNTAL
jgi:electron transport complex protein RnfC